MKIIYILLSSCIIFLFFLFNAHADQSLNEISNFAKEICDDIQAKGKRTITATEVEAELKGKIGKVFKYIGVDVGADGKYTIGKSQEEYEGIPYGSISEQMSDCRSCRLEISKLLLNERRKVLERLDNDHLSKRKFEVEELSTEYQNLKERFIKFAIVNKEVNNSSPLPLGGFDKHTYSEYIETKMKTMDGAMQTTLLMATLSQPLKEIQEGTKIINRSLDQAMRGKISQSDEFIQLKNDGLSLSHKTQAVLFEMVDLMQKRASSMRK